MNNKSPNRKFKFRKWIHSRFTRSGTWLDIYREMNRGQKIVFHLFGRIPKNLRPEFESLELEEMVGIDKEGKEIYVGKKVDLRGCL